MAEITKMINIIRLPDDSRDYAAEFIQSTNHNFGLVEVYEKHRTDLARAYCKDINIFFAVDDKGEIVFDATRNHNGEYK